MELHHRLIVLYDQMLGVELRTLQENLIKLRESAGDEALFAQIVAGQGVSAHHGPIDVIGDMIEEGRTVAGLQALEDF
jgi:hypothetical protein